VDGEVDGAVWGSVGGAVKDTGGDAGFALPLGAGAGELKLVIPQVAWSGTPQAT
jgi:hypothetical protein